MVSKITIEDDEEISRGDRERCVIIDTILPNLEAFWTEYDKKKAERDPKLMAIDEDFHLGFVSEDRDEELAQTAL